MKMYCLPLRWKALSISLLLLIFGLPFLCHAIHYPIQFAIPSQKIVKTIPKKDRDFAFIIPGNQSTYIYNSEEAYYEGYQRAYFGVTCKKSGWDCMRHYEILANGCIPYFIDLDKCNPNTMYFLPKDLIMEAMHLPGVCYETLSIDHTLFDHAKYYEILNKLLEHTRNYLTTEKMAAYILHTAGYTGKKPVLFLSQDPNPDYMRCLMLTGLKQILGDNVVDFPRIPHIYTDYSQDVKALYGKGISYTKMISPDNADRSHLESRIKNKEFELIIYGSLHRGLPFLDHVRQHYSDKEIIFICGEDKHKCMDVPSSVRLFLREFDCKKVLKKKG